MPSPKRGRKLPKNIAVADSSLWISALQFGGVPLQALLHAGPDHLVCCAYIRNEVERRLVTKFSWTAAAVQASMQIHLRMQDVVTTGSITGQCRDPQDDAVLECAVLAQASYLITGDKDLLSLGEFRGIAIMTPRRFLSSAR